MRKILMSILAASACAVCSARPAPPPGHRVPPPRHFVSRRPYHPVCHHHGHRCSGWWGPAFVGGVVGGAVAAAVVSRPEPTVVVQPAPVVMQPAPVVVQPAPVVVRQPVVVQEPRRVWVDGHYEDQVSPSGSVRVWVPGHWEVR